MASVNVTCDTTCPDVDKDTYDRIVLEPSPDMEKEIEEAKGQFELFAPNFFQLFFNFCLQNNVVTLFFSVVLFSKGKFQSILLYLK